MSTPSLYTHYIPSAYRVQAQTQRTACCKYISPSQHSNNPTCPTCRRAMEEENRNDEADFRAMGFVKDTDGTWVHPGAGRLSR